MEKSYNIQLTELAHKKIMYWVNKCDKEVSGFGIVKYNPEQLCFHITDAFLVEQEVGSAHTDIDEKGLNKLMFQTIDHDGELLFWWHSHVNMDTFWSGQDIDTIKKLGKNGWICASVFNKKDSVRSACAFVAKSSLNNDTPELVLYDDIQTYIEHPVLDDEFKKELDKEFTDKVKVKTYSNWTCASGTFDDWVKKHDDKVDAIATRNIRETEVLTSEELEDVIQYGLRGYGAEVEAEALKLNLQQYKNILKINNFNQVCNLEDRLISMENDGTLDKILYSMAEDEAISNNKSSKQTRKGHRQ